jgi:anti-sigma B factor antagonist
MLSVDLASSDCGGRVVVTLRGELDVMDAEAVAVALAAAADRGNVVIVDLAGLTFIDAGGMATLVRARRHACHTGGALVLAAPQRQVRRVLALTGQAGAFSVHADAAEAIASMGGSVAVTAVAALPALLRPHDPASGSLRGEPEDRELAGGRTRTTRR